MALQLATVGQAPPAESKSGGELMALYAQVINNTITNTVACDAAFAAAHGLTEIDNLSPVPGIGWTLSGGVWSAPTPSPNGTNLQTLRSKAQTALSNNQTFLGIASPTNAQAVAQVQALTKQVDTLIRLVCGQLNSTQGT